MFLNFLSVLTANVSIILPSPFHFQICHNCGNWLYFLLWTNVYNWCLFLFQWQCFDLLYCWVCFQWGFSISAFLSLTICCLGDFFSQTYFKVFSSDMAFLGFCLKRKISVVLVQLFWEDTERCASLCFKGQYWDCSSFSAESTKSYYFLNYNLIYCL